LTKVEFGVTLIETRTGAITVSTPDALIVPYVAEMLVAPGISPVASPLEFNIATAGTDELQLADCVMSWVEPSL
jgi:hypothetical protein